MVLIDVFQGTGGWGSAEWREVRKGSLGHDIVPRRDSWFYPPRGHQKHPISLSTKNVPFISLFLRVEKIHATEIKICKSVPPPPPPCEPQGLNSGHQAWWLDHLACLQITFCGFPSFAQEHCMTSSSALAGKVEAKVRLRDYLQASIILALVFIC